MKEEKKEGKEGIAEVKDLLKTLVSHVLKSGKKGEEKSGDIATILKEKLEEK